MVDEKIAKLVARLHEKTAAGAVGWEKTVDDGVFQAAFPQFAIRIRPAGHDEEGDSLYQLEIYNDDVELVEEVSTMDLQGHVEAPWRRLHEIYVNARRIAMGVSEAIDTLLSELGEEPEADDDIPF